MKFKPYFRLILLFVFIASIPVSIYSCSGGKSDTSDVSKIHIDLSEFTDDGKHITTPPEDGGYINYEFCIPADEEHFKEVSSIDSTLGYDKIAKGRSGCSDKEWLCIGSSRQKNFKKVLLALAKLSYIRKITQTFWE